MNDKERKAAAKNFAAQWIGRGDEKQETQAFWNSFLRDIFEIEKPETFIKYEVPIKFDNTNFIDGLIPSTGVLIEQKSKDIDLTKKYKQSDGQMLTPFQQAWRYAGSLPHDQNPRWIVVSNFQEFHLHDMNHSNDKPVVIMLDELEKEIHLFKFIIEEKEDKLKKEEKISKEAGIIVGKIYDALLEQYDNPEDEQVMHDLNVLCVRLVFCFYAEDAGLFNNHKMFYDYLKSFKPEESAQALAMLFDVLNTDYTERKKYLSPTLKAFPYVNGGLFENEIEIPLFNEKIMDLLIHEGSEGIDWSEISPTIFGAIFESTLNPETRRSGGMHYTSIENIHKVIDPLFLDDLKDELQSIKQLPDIRNKYNESKRTKALVQFQNKLAKLTFLDPAAGSGNFLTETFVCLRRLENEVIKEMGLQVSLYESPIKVAISQFYGIEINDFAVSVAKAALWIAESQMFNETNDIVKTNLDFLPLESNANIVEGNALQLNWEDVVPKYKLNYIMGNPPFVGSSIKKTAEKQKADKELVFGKAKAGKLDYVACWYKKAFDYIDNTDIEVAFVSTNSITQGEQVRPLWEPILSAGLHINYAYRTFKWESDANSKAQVHCVIISVSKKERENKFIVENEKKFAATHINGYLIDAPDFYITSRGSEPKGFPKLTQGNKPWDDGGLIVSAAERADLIRKYPQLEEHIKLFLGAREFINNKKRYCLWLKGVSPNVYKNIPEIKERFEIVAKCREESPTVEVQKQAETPMLFSQIRQPQSDYILVPETSSSSRKYIPMGFMSKDVIVSNSTLTAENASLYMFGILQSNVHMMWVKTLCGRMKSDYRYSPAMYNNFPWITPTEEQKQKIEKTAQEILDARAKYSDCSLADLYDKAMPEELSIAHKHNNIAVMELYGLKVSENGKNRWMTELEALAKLMKMHQKLTEK